MKTKYFTAIGLASAPTMTARGTKIVKLNFNHVVSANDAEEASNKVHDYYSSREIDPMEVQYVEIFDFIE